MFIPLFLLSVPGRCSGSRKWAEGFGPVRLASLMYLLWISHVKGKLLVLVIFAYVYITLVLLQLFIADGILIWSGSAFACSKPFWRFYWCLLWGWWDGSEWCWPPNLVTCGQPKNPYKGRRREPTTTVISTHVGGGKSSLQVWRG